MAVELKSLFCIYFYAITDRTIFFSICSLVASLRKLALIGLADKLQEVVLGLIKVLLRVDTIDNDPRDKLVRGLKGISQRSVLMMKLVALIALHISWFKMQHNSEGHGQYCNPMTIQ